MSWPCVAGGTVREQMENQNGNQYSPGRVMCFRGEKIKIIRFTGLFRGRSPVFNIYKYLMTIL